MSEIYDLIKEILQEGKSSTEKNDIQVERNLGWSSTFNDPGIDLDFHFEQYFEFYFYVLEYRNDKVCDIKFIH